MKKILSTILAVLICFTVFPISVSAANGPNSANDTAAYISLYGDEASYQLFSMANANDEEPVAGATYNKATNTLTLANYKHPEMSVEANEMGDDFTLKLVGTNEVSRITVWGYGYGGSLRITGTGSIVINKNKNDCGIDLKAEGSASKLVIDNGAKVKVYGETNGCVRITQTSVGSKAIAIDGQTATKVHVSSEQFESYTSVKTFRVDNLTQFEKYKINNDSNIYGALHRTMYNAKGVLLGTFYFMYKMVKLENGCTLAVCLSNTGTQLVPEQFIADGTDPIEAVNTDEYDLMQKFTKKGNDTDVFGSYHYYNQAEYYDMYKLEKCTVKEGFVAVPVEGEDKRVCVPNDYSPIFDKFYYNYYIDNTEINIVPYVPRPAATKITNVTLTNKTAAKITWNNISNATYYFVSTYKAGKLIERIKVVGNSYVKKRLAAGVKYTFKVASANGLGVSAESNVKSITTMNYSKKPVITLGATKKTASVKLKSGLPGAKGYESQLSTNSRFKKSVVKASLKNNKAKFNSLKSKKTYYARVRAYNIVGGKKCYGAWSKSQNVKIK